MLKIRLQRIGRRNNPSYRIVVVDSRAAAKKGKPVELLGSYDTIRKKTALNKERVLYWMSRGAQVSDTVHNILVAESVIEGRKKNVLPKKSPVKKDSDDGAVAATASGGADVSGAEVSTDAPDAVVEQTVEPAEAEPTPATDVPTAEPAGETSAATESTPPTDVPTTPPTDVPTAEPAEAEPTPATDVPTAEPAEAEPTPATDVPTAEPEEVPIDEPPASTDTTKPSPATPAATNPSGEG